MDSLVQRLSQGKHPVALALQPEPTAKALEACIDRGYVRVRFTGTQGGTELGIRLDRQLTDLKNCDLERRSGVARLVGTLVLNYVPVWCTAEIQLETFTGEGRLEPTGTPMHPSGQPVVSN